MSHASHDENDQISPAMTGIDVEILASMVEKIRQSEERICQSEERICQLEKMILLLFNATYKQNHSKDDDRHDLRNDLNDRSEKYYRNNSRDHSDKRIRCAICRDKYDHGYRNCPMYRNGYAIRYNRNLY